MEDKIEAGEYVRTDYGEIHKVVHVVEDDGDWNYYRYENTMGDFQMSIVKHSKQLIDLIEVGDIVNEYRVKAVYLEGATKYIKLSNSYENGQGIRTYEEDIKTILTKERYKANCYKVGGEKWD